MANKKSGANAASRGQSSNNGSARSQNTSRGSGTPAYQAATTASTPTSGQAHPMAAPNSPRFLLIIGAFYAVVAAIALYFHYKLPAPISAAQSAASELRGEGPLMSEENMLKVMEKISVDIGYRIVGTEEHVRAEEWVLEQLKPYEGVHTLGDGKGGNVEVEIWHQVDDGGHRFDFMSSVVWKKYMGMSNIIVRISDGTEESKANSVLINSHLDSTLPSPGAVDDGVGVGIMMELVRVLTTPSPKRKPLRHSAVLLFNNGEESLQDASYLYITSNHTTVPTVRSLINLEACGVSGPELLFQAQHAEMIKAYSKVPHPFGTVLANDVFSSGIVLSDTDFVVIQEQKQMGGLDMAIVGNSYLYHTRRDLPQYLQPGAAQHFGENVLAIVEYLTTSQESQLARIRPTPKADTPVYFSLLGRFFVNIPAKAFKSLSMGMSAFANFQIQAAVRADKPYGALKATTLSIFGSALSLIAALAASNVVAVIMTKVLDKPLSWFSNEWLPVPLYAAPAIAAVLSVQLGISKLVAPRDRPYLERSSFSGLLIFFILGLIILNAFSIGSAYMCMLGTVSILLSIIVNDFILIGWNNIELHTIPVNRRVHPATYFIFAITPAVVGAEGLTSFLDLFVPLMGRTGAISPADHILASIVAALSFLGLPLLVPLSHRFGLAFLRRSIVFLLSLTVAGIALYAAQTPFDQMHPQRLFVHQVQNISSGQWFMNLGFADPASPRIAQSLSDGLRMELGSKDAVEAAQLMPMDKYNPDFDILYPVSNFITPYKFPLPAPTSDAAIVTRWDSNPNPAKNFAVRAVNDVVDLDASTRRLKLEITHADIIWSVLAFDAEILEWDLPVPPPQGLQRHHIKEVSRYGRDLWSIDLLLRLQPDQLQDAKRRLGKTSGQRSSPDFGLLVRTDADGSVSTSSSAALSDSSRLRIDYSGLWGAAMYPMAERSKDPEVHNSEGVVRFKHMDAWLAQHHPEIDAMLLNVVAGVAVA